MLFPVNIARQLRVVLTAITLLLMVGLNNREVTTYGAAPASETGQQVNKSAADRNGTVKQKVSFEATSSYLVLQLAAAIPHFLNFSFSKPLFLHVAPLYPGGIVLGYFKTLLSATIQANAP